MTKLINAAKRARSPAATGAAAEAQELALRRAAARSTGTLESSAYLELTRPAPIGAPSLGAVDRRPSALSRDPCQRCGVRGQLGCEHQQPFGTVSAAS